MGTAPGNVLLTGEYAPQTLRGGEMQRSLQLIFGAVIFLLLIACANVANLQLAKATARAREMAVRLSLGAGRGQLIRQLLTESILVSVLGGLLGLLFAYLITHLTVALMPGNNVPAEARIEVNRYVLSFSVIISALTGIIFGLAPALQASRPNLVETLKDEGRGSSGLTGGKTRGFLVITEVALSVDILALIFRAGGKLVGFGIIIGIAGSLAAARVLQSQLDLFQVTSGDPLSFAAMIVLLIIVAGGACLIPARRATRVEPVVALRYE
jgi:ABC-type antimicrobial peptide transport system permease subunit